MALAQAIQEKAKLLETCGKPRRPRRPAPTPKRHPSRPRLCPTALSASSLTKAEAGTGATKRYPRLYVATCLLFLLVSAYMHQQPFKCPTPLSRLSLLHALTLRRVYIDVYREKTPDSASYGGHFYSDK